LPILGKAASVAFHPHYVAGLGFREISKEQIFLKMSNKLKDAYEFLSPK
jgi:hypothetical protein